MGRPDRGGDTIRRASGVGDAGAAIPDGGAPSAVTTEQSSRKDDDELNIDDVLLDGVGLPVIIFDASGDIVTWNRSLGSLTGLDGEEASRESHAAAAFYGTAAG